MTVVMSGADRVVLLAAGQNVLHPHSHAEHEISLLWWVMFVGSCIGLALIGFLLLLGWLRRNQPMLPFGIVDGDDRARGRPSVVVGDPLSRHACGHGERDAHSGEYARADPGHDRRHHPQHLAAGAEPEGRRRSWARQPALARRKPARDIRG